jgi:hypothetical protein
MKWINHEIVTGVIVYGATQDMLAAAFAMGGAIFPIRWRDAPARLTGAGVLNTGAGRIGR